MTSPAQVDVKGKGKPRGRRRPEADGPPTDGPPGPPTAEAAREGQSRRERRAREQAEEAAEFEAAALNERPRQSRRERRARKRLEPDVGSPKESRRERRARKRRQAAGATATSEGTATGGLDVELPAEDERPPPPTGDPRAPRPATEDPPVEGGPASVGPIIIGADRPRLAGGTTIAEGRPGQARGAAGGSQRRPSAVPPPPAGAPPRHRPPGKYVPRAVVLRQRRRRRRMIIGTTIILVIVNLLVGGTYAYFQWRLDQISRVQVPGLTDDVPGQVMNVLLVGSDSRERLTGDAAAQAGKDQVGGQRSDTIMVLHVDPRQQRAAILSIPRDLYLPIAGTQGSDRINTAFAIGGAERLITTLVNMGIQVNHYAEVDFVGFREIVDAVGGVTVHLPHWARDFSSGLDLPRSGCVELDGTQALAYVRSRDFETLVDGKWVADPRGDLGRIERQQDFIRRVMKKGVSTGISNPVALNRLIGIGVRNLTIDTTMSTSDITNVARRFRSVDPDSVETLVLPTAPQVIDGKDVLVLKEQEAQDEVAKINGFAPVSPPTTAAGTTPSTASPGAAALPFRPADLRIQVLNGNGVKGTATTAGEALKLAGFTVVGTGDAPPAARTVIRHRPGQQAKAQAIQNGLEAGAQLREDATLRATDVVLVLGADYKGFKTAAAPAPGVSATPAPAPPGGAPKHPC